MKVYHPKEKIFFQPIRAESLNGFLDKLGTQQEVFQDGTTILEVNERDGATRLFEYWRRKHRWLTITTE